MVDYSVAGKAITSRREGKDIVDTRMQRKEISELVWSRAAFYGNMMARLPNVEIGIGNRFSCCG